MDLRMMKVAIQGAGASFHDLAAKKHFGEAVDIVHCSTFRESCEMLADNLVDYTLIAVNNSIAGNILPNYELVSEYKLCVIGEEYLKIALHLMGTKGSSLDEIRHIRSHPMALRQCTEFLASLSDTEVIEAADTAFCAKEIAQKGLRDTAAIAGYEAAERYGLDIISENIQSVTENYTRFWILSKGNSFSEKANKATLQFDLIDKAGLLAEALAIFGRRSLNFSSIQSLTMAGADRLHRFYADIEYSSLEHFQTSLSELNLIGHSIRVMGLYEKAGRPEISNAEEKQKEVVRKRSDQHKLILTP